MRTDLFYLDSYVLQKDMRMRLPKALLANLPIICGVTKLGVYVDRSSNEIVLRIENPNQEQEVNIDERN